MPLNCRTEADLCEGTFFTAKSFFSSVLLRIVFLFFLVFCYYVPLPTEPRTSFSQNNDIQQTEPKKKKSYLHYSCPDMKPHAYGFVFGREPFTPAAKANCHDNRSSSLRHYLRDPPPLADLPHSLLEP